MRSEEETARVLDGIDREGPPLAGVFHLAATLDDGLLLGQDEARFRTVLDPKIAGAWNLHRLTAGRPLEAFVLFASAASVLGSPGQANYAAANAFLEALARHRRALGLPALSVHWGPWTRVGQAAAASGRGERLALRGFPGIEPELGLGALARILDRPEPALAALPLDVRLWREAYPPLADSPFLSALAGADRPRPGDDRLARELRSLDPAAREIRLAALVRTEVARTLRLAPDRLEPDTPFGSFGLDSLMALETRNRLEAALGLRLPATLLYAHPTARALATHLAGELSEPSQPMQTEAPLDRPEIDGLSPDALADLLAAELDSARDLLGPDR